MSPIFQSLTVLVLIVTSARFIKRKSRLLQHWFIPSSLVAGFIGLLIGPQVLSLVSNEVYSYWEPLPKHLISVVFAGLFLGRVIPRRKEIWRLAGPQIAFGNTLAWGQYVLGLLATMFILTPYFGTNPLAGALVEISFEGGHGTASGLAPTFAELGWSEGTDIALVLATFSIIIAIISGILSINWYHRKAGRLIGDQEWETQKKQLIRSGYNLITLGRKISTTPKKVFINILAFSLAIGLGWLLLQGLILLEESILRQFTDLRFFTYVPLFTFAMIGGLILQMILRRIGRERFISRRTAQIISGLALDILITTAIATLSLNIIGDNLATILVLGILGVVWILFGFIVLAPKMFPNYWFEKGLTNMGQSMGMTATGLLLMRMADPTNHSRAKESFAYKQLVFEPFMGGGLITAASVIFIYEFGSLPVLIICSVVTSFWLILGIKLKKRVRLKTKLPLASP